MFFWGCLLKFWPVILSWGVIRTLESWFNFRNFWEKSYPRPYWRTCLWFYKSFRSVLPGCTRWTFWSRSCWCSCVWNWRGRRWLSWLVCMSLWINHWYTVPKWCWVSFRRWWSQLVVFFWWFDPFSVFLFRSNLWGVPQRSENISGLPRCTSWWHRYDSVLVVRSGDSVVRCWWFRDLRHLFCGRCRCLWGNRGRCGSWDRTYRRFRWVGTVCYVCSSCQCAGSCDK